MEHRLPERVSLARGRMRLPEVATGQRAGQSHLPQTGPINVQHRGHKPASRHPRGAYQGGFPEDCPAAFHRAFPRQQDGPGCRTSRNRHPAHRDPVERQGERGRRAAWRLPRNKPSPDGVPLRDREAVRILTSFAPSVSPNSTNAATGPPRTVTYIARAVWLRRCTFPAASTSLLRGASNSRQPRAT